ncbi:hypothetical protein JCM15765_17250 [Paradesulfitobacterium aromaticivorans]
MSVLIVGGVVLVTIFLIIAVSAGRGRRFEGEQVRSEDMIKTVYIYIVLLATLMMTIGGSVAAFMAVADIASPPSYYMSFAEYQRMPEKLPDQKQPALTEQELRKNYDDLVAQEKQRARDRAVNSLIKSFGWIVIPAPIFLYFQRKLKAKS